MKLIAGVGVFKAGKNWLRKAKIGARRSSSDCQDASQRMIEAKVFFFFT
jgi:hypothetical protein